MKRTIFASAAIVAAGAFMIGAAPARKQGAARNTTQGVYTEEQAKEGGELYLGVCAACHGASLEGSWEIPALKGRFMHGFGGRPVGTLFHYVSHAMPQMAPGSLSPEDNAKIVAYLLKENGMPAGTRPLSSDKAALDRIMLTPVRPH